MGSPVVPGDALQAQRDAKQRLVFMGLRRSGKSSIINVVLYKLPPTETVFIPTTIHPKKHVLRSFKNFPIWDLPGQIDYLAPDRNPDDIFSDAGAMVWVVDAQDDYLESIAKLTDTILQLQQMYPDIKYIVLIHKVDSLSSDYKEETIRDIIQRIMDDLNDAGLDNPAITFYPTSVYDDSIYEALSKVIQMLNPHVGTFEALLSTIQTSCKMQKLYLFDIDTKLYIASDTSPVDMAGYSLCSDFIDTIFDFSEIYGWERKGRANGEAEDNGPGFVTGKDDLTQAFISGIRGYCLYLKEMDRRLALIGFSKEARFMDEKPLIDYNVSQFQVALSQVLALT